MPVLSHGGNGAFAILRNIIKIRRQRPGSVVAG
jgi:hypothetical protein